MPTGRRASLPLPPAVGAPGAGSAEECLAPLRFFLEEEDEEDEDEEDEDRVREDDRVAGILVLPDVDAEAGAGDDAFAFAFLAGVCFFLGILQETRGKCSIQNHEEYLWRVLYIYRCIV